MVSNPQSIGLLLILSVGLVVGTQDVPVMTVVEMIEYWGYPVEDHQVTTSDGYILTMHRIPGGRDEVQDPGQQGQKTPVFLGHCLLCTSAVFAFGPPTKSLAYVLADAGFDVWMGNTRGSTWSKNHTTLDTGMGSEAFWDFGWDKTGRLDYSAEIDYILEQTSFDQLFVVGYSMGASQYLVLLSEMPEYNAKVKAGVLMGPPAFMGHATHPIFLLAEAAEDITDLIHELGIYEFLPSSDLMHYIAHEVCDDEHPVGASLCSNLFFAFFQVSYSYMNVSMIPFYLDHLPGGTSTQTFVHYAQLFLDKDRFARYDYGPVRNQLEYGQDTPPEYDLSKVSAPTALFVGNADDLADPVDAALLMDRLPNVIYNEIVDFDGWNHFDFFANMETDRVCLFKIRDLLLQLNTE
ncbi:lipase 3-like [Tigriopus californicus]|uniref:lipase 3-like n=1 Tax=Tigriopus californicus TaxID=6832 RepID=UPI0027DA7947|nr:lipase 3-like [Tigriopus californicus]